MTSSRDPELASILRSLSQYAPRATPQLPAVLQQKEDSSYGARNPPATFALAPDSRSSLSQPETQDPRRRATTPSVDPSRITTWPTALKYVTSNMLSNQITAARIKHLLKTQHDHERQWWAGREEIVAKHKGRDESKKKANNLLRSLGGTNLSPPKVNSTPIEEGEAELERYDKKVYVALTRLVADVDRDLKSLGIPFYAIKHELVVLKQGQGPENNEERIDKDELRELQKRMLQLLEDLFK